MALQGNFDKLKEVGPRATTFLSEVWAELKKVHWPTRKETYAATVIVLVVTILVALFLGAVDFAIARVIQTFLS